MSEYRLLGRCAECDSDVIGIYIVWPKGSRSKILAGIIRCDHVSERYGKERHYGENFEEYCLRIWGAADDQIQNQRNQPCKNL